MNKIKQWLLDNYDLETINDICDHGIDAGFLDLTYYKDTNEFYDKFEDEIWEMLNEDADDQGMSAMELIATFRCSKKMSTPVLFKNYLCWYGVERECFRINHENS